VEAASSHTDTQTHRHTDTQTHIHTDTQLMVAPGHAGHALGCASRAAQPLKPATDEFGFGTRRPEAVAEAEAVAAV
jgi:hypothetical protein